MKGNQFSVSDTFTEFLSRGPNNSFLKTKWCNFIRHCDEGQNIFTTVVYLDWLAVWTMLLAGTGTLPAQIEDE